MSRPDSFNLGFSSALVTGGTGFIGSALVRKLAEEKIKVYCLVRHSGRDSRWMDQIPGVVRIQVEDFSGSVTNALKNFRTDCVFNLASYGVSQSDRDSSRMLDINVGFLLRLLESTSDWQLKRFIHTGSCFEYGSPMSERPLTEVHPLNTSALYGSSKASATLMGLALARALHCPFLTLRLFGVFGRGEQESRLIPALRKSLEQNQVLELTGGAQKRDLNYIDDILDAYLAAASAPDLPVDVYNVSSGTSHTIRDIAETLAKCLDRPASLLHFGAKPYRSDEPMYLVGDSSKFRERSGWKPKYDLLSGIQAYLLECRQSGVAIR